MSNVVSGSVVRLKSGGPLMTVRWVQGHDAYCDWFDDNKQVGAKFAVPQLDLEEEEEE